MGSVKPHPSRQTSGKDSKRRFSHGAALPGRLPGDGAASCPPMLMSSTFLGALAGGLLLWAAFPPLKLWPLAWVAPVFWVRLVRRRTLEGRRPYVALYLAGLVHWLILIQWVRLPHWSAYFGWLALAFYLGLYLPGFIGLARVAVHRLRVPVVLAAPAVWTGLELFRGYFLTGFSLALLGHTQETRLPLIQVSDLFGAYGVSFVVMLVAACLARALACDEHRRTWTPLVGVPVVLACVLAYGYWRLSTPTVADNDSSGPIQVALVQGSIDTQFGGTRAQVEQMAEDTFTQYCELTDRAVAKNSPLDLIVWPESMFTSNWPVVTYDEDCRPGPDVDLSAEQFRDYLSMWRLEFQRKAKWMAQAAGTPLMVGTDALHYTGRSVRRYNSAILIDRAGTLAGQYDKVHRVMFGEYVPLGQWLPWLYRLTPMHSGLTPGRGPVALDVGPLRLSPSICFENTVPHLIRRQVAQLTSEGTPPDILVTLTNDGWFWGSSLLDLHLTCGRFRAVELRLPTLIAANTGFSAWIDGNGRIRAVGPRHATAVVTATVRRDGRTSFYRLWGDWAAGICLAVCLVSAFWGVWSTIRHGHRAEK